MAGRFGSAGIVLAGQLTYTQPHGTGDWLPWPGRRCRRLSRIRLHRSVARRRYADQRDSSELIPDPAAPHHIRLTATLNRAEFDQELPLLELTLTDTPATRPLSNASSGRPNIWTVAYSHQHAGQGGNPGAAVAGYRRHQGSRASPVPVLPEIACQPKEFGCL